MFLSGRIGEIYKNGYGELVKCTPFGTVAIGGLGKRELEDDFLADDLLADDFYAIPQRRSLHRRRYERRM